MFVLRTLLEKASNANSNINNNLSLAFVDLAKAFDKVPHDLLWEKLSKMGCRPKFVKVIQSLYKNTYVNVSINGHLSEQVYIKSGVKQGCPLSPLLFTLFLSDLGLFIETAPHGILIRGVRISGLLFIDDLVIIARDLSLCEDLLTTCNTYFNQNGLQINFSKSQILTKTNSAAGMLQLPQDSTNKVVELEIKKKYKYLGVTIRLGRPCDIHGCIKRFRAGIA